MDKITLDQIVARAKEEGLTQWEIITREAGISSGQTPSPHVFNRFADWCESGKVFFLQEPKVNNLREFEAFLRAGKHMPRDVKIANRKIADRLYDEILKDPNL